MLFEGDWTPQSSFENTTIDSWGLHIYHKNPPNVGKYTIKVYWLTTKIPVKLGSIKPLYLQQTETRFWLLLTARRPVGAFSLSGISWI